MATKKSAGAAAETFPRTCSGAELAVLLGINPRNVREWAQRGVLKRVKSGQFHVVESVQNYTAHLREQAAGRATSSGQNLADEKALELQVRREIGAIKLATLRGEVLTKDEVSTSWSLFAGAVKSAFLSVPTKARTKIPHLTAHDGETLRTLVRDILSDLVAEAKVMEPSVDPKVLKDGK